MIRRRAERMKERGTVPELEVFDWGMVDYARYPSSAACWSRPSTAAPSRRSWLYDTVAAGAMT
jgi:uncharacterized protein (DUF849 family)